MTVFMAGASVLLALLVSGVSADAARGATLRLRAQTAADAAALAAVAESLPDGDGLPAGAAARYASANGAVVVGCLCPPGATAMQVRVAIQGVEASARAVLDPDLLMPRVTATSADGLHPSLASAVSSLVHAAHGDVWIVSGYRSAQEQAALWAAALARYGSAEAADDWVAPPGHSMHERGLAVDLGGDLVLAQSLVSSLRLPLHRPLAHEPWHFELVGSRGGPP